MWNRSRQGIQLTKQRLRDKLLAGPTSRSYFTEALLSIGEKKKKKKNDSGTERESEGWREKEQRKMFPPNSTNLWMNNSISFQWSPRALVPSVHTTPCMLCTPSLLYPFAHLRQQDRAKVAWLVCTPNGRHYELSLHPKYRTGRQRRPFSAFFSPHFFLDLHRFSNPQLEKHWSTSRFLIAVIYPSALNYRSVELPCIWQKE